MRSVFLVRPDAAELRLRVKGVGWIWAWLPAAIACGAIAFESTQLMSANHTSSWLRPVVERIFGHMRDNTWGWVHHLIRKTGHFTGYGVVCLTFLRGWLLTLACCEGLTDRAWRWRSCGLAVASTFLVASCDEIHQTFVPGRTGMFSDVLLDTGGAVVMCGVVSVVWWFRRARRNQG
jgi:VanZ family protein